MKRWISRVQVKFLALLPKEHKEISEKKESYQRIGVSIEDEKTCQIWNYVTCLIYQF